MTDKRPDISLSRLLVEIHEAGPLPRRLDARFRPIWPNPAQMSDHAFYHSWGIRPRDGLAAYDLHGSIADEISSRSTTDPPRDDWSPTLSCQPRTVLDDVRDLIGAS